MNVKKRKAARRMLLEKYGPDKVSKSAFRKFQKMINKEKNAPQ